MNRQSPARKADAERSGIQALDSALTVLHVMARMTGPAGLTEIARRAEMPASKVHRYLASFAKAGLVRQTHKAGLYTLAKEALDLGLAAMARMNFVDEAAERLDDLVAQTGAAGLIAVWGPHGATVVRWHRTGSFVITSLGLGTTLPLLNSATGRVFLAYSRPQVIEAQLRAEILQAQHQNLRWPDLDPTRPDQIEDLTSAVRARGYASVDGRFIPGLNAISAPVLNWQGEAEAAVTLTSGDAAILQPNAVALSLLRDTCRALSITGSVAETDVAPRADSRG